MQVSLIDFKDLLAAIKEENIRLKVKTHTGWSKNYLHIIGFITPSKDLVTKNFQGVVLSNVNETEGILINDISTINAFELERSCQDLKAQTVYNLVDNISFKPLILN